jgi:hypothetical protein
MAKLPITEDVNIWGRGNALDGEHPVKIENATLFGWGGSRDVELVIKVRITDGPFQGRSVKVALKGERQTS